MPRIVRFEEIQAWQEARTLTRTIYRLTSSGQWAKDFGLRDQIRRASVSVMSNIAEGFDRAGTTEFRRLLTIAKGSAAEVKSQIHVAYDLSYLSEQDFRDAIKQGGRCLSPDWGVHVLPHRGAVEHQTRELADPQTCEHGPRSEHIDYHARPITLYCLQCTSQKTAKVVE